MKSHSNLFSLTQNPVSGKPPRQLVVILHGYGANAEDLFPLVELFAKALPDAQFVVPNAPEICEINPDGFQWFSLEDRTPQIMLKGAVQAAALVNPFLDEALDSNGLENSQLALIGFSQGTMTALHVALRRVPCIAAVVGFSGRLVGASTLGSELQSKPPVCLIHGQSDQVVPHSELKLATDALRLQGVAVESHSLPQLGHGIDMRGIQLASKFLKDRFPASND